MPPKRHKNGFRGPTPEVGKATQFKPGNPGGGRPKKRLLDEAIEEILLECDSTEALAIARAIVTKAKNGDSRAAQLLAERTQGKPRQSVTIDGSINITAEERAARIAEIVAGRIGNEVQP